MAAPSTRAAARVDYDRVRQAFSQLASGVAALHAHGKLHRDIKPSNTIVRADGTVLLMDFGLVTDSAVVALSEPSTEPRSVTSSSGGSSSSDTTGHVLVGTVKYMPPEQAAAQRATEASDW
jgi:serine/threonine protein kinase